MGYETYYSLSWERLNGKSVPKSISRDIGQYIDADEDMSYALESDGTGKQPCKWYEHERCMQEMSEDFPDVVFTLSGQGEEPGDLWLKYFYQGGVQEAPAIISYEKFNIGKLVGRKPAHERHVVPKPPSFAPGSVGDLASNPRRKASVQVLGEDWRQSTNLLSKSDGRYAIRELELSKEGNDPFQPGTRILFVDSELNPVMLVDLPDGADVYGDDSSMCFAVGDQYVLAGDEPWDASQEHDVDDLLDKHGATIVFTHN